MQNLINLQYVLNSISAQGYQKAFNNKAPFLAKLPLVAGKGADIEVKIHYAGNAGGGSFGSDDEITGSGKQAYRTIHFPWKRVYKAISIDGLAQAVSQAGGIKDINNLSEDEATKAVRDLYKMINDQLLGDGTGNDGKDIQGIQYHINDSGDYANEALDRATYGWLAALVHDNGGTLRNISKTLIDNLANALNDVRGSSWNQAWTSSTMYSAYENLLGNSVRRTTVEIGDIKFKALDIQGKPLISIPGYPANRIDFVESDGFMVKYLPQKAVDTLGQENEGLIKVMQLPTSKDADEAALVAYLNLVCENVYMAGSLQDIQ